MLLVQAVVRKVKAVNPKATKKQFSEQLSDVRGAVEQCVETMHLESLQEYHVMLECLELDDRVRGSVYGRVGSELKLYHVFPHPATD